MKVIYLPITTGQTAYHDVDITKILHSFYARVGSRNFHKMRGRPIVQIFPAPSRGASFTLKTLNLGQNRGGGARCAPAP